MDITPTTPTTNANSNTAGAAAAAAAVAQPPKSPDLDSETPTRIQPAKPLPFTNGVLKRHYPHQHHGHHHHHHHLSVPPVVITYKDCLKNHAAALGGHAVDGCGEFMPSPSATPTDPTSLKCAACGCHRNFHRREPEDSPPHLNTTTTIEYQPHHRHHPPPPPPQPHRSPNSASPPPISSSYYPSAPHMLLALSGGVSGLNDSNAAMNIIAPGSSARKRFRTKFSQSQKERMHQFAERVGWKIQKRDEDLIQEFCNEVGVDKGVLKVWMHNNKNTYGKRDSINGAGSISGRSNNINNNVEDHHHHHDNHQNHNNNNNSNNDNNNNNNNSSSENLNLHPLNFESDSHAGHVGTNGSSSSS